MATEIARNEDIDELTEQHWRVIKFMRAEGIEANLFFTFFGLDAIHQNTQEHIKVTTVGNPGRYLATVAGLLPGVSSVMTRYLERKMGKLDSPPIPEFLQMIADTGAGLSAARPPGTSSISPGTTSSNRLKTSSRSESSTRWPRAARSSSLDH